MTRRLAAAFVLAFGLAPAGPAPAGPVAGPVAGADDPAFRSAFERALTGDDPGALLDLHAAAEAGNIAALIALPAVNDWLRARLSFPERKRVARVNGTPLAEAVVAADPVAALWAGGDALDPAGTLDRVFGLMAAGEVEKGTALFQTWFNQTGAQSSLPDGLFDLPLPDTLLAVVLMSRMRSFDAAIEADTVNLMIRRLQADDPSAFLALAGLAGMHRPEATPLASPVDLAAIAGAAGLDPESVGRRIADLAPALIIATAQGREVDPATALAGLAQMQGEPGLMPVRALCRTACPETQDACAAAFVTAYGLPKGWFAASQPFVSLISPADFLATPLGSGQLLQALVPVAPDDPRLKVAGRIDACLTNHLLAQGQ